MCLHLGTVLDLVVTVNSDVLLQRLLGKKIEELEKDMPIVTLG